MSLCVVGEIGKDLWFTIIGGERCGVKILWCLGNCVVAFGIVYLFTVVALCVYLCLHF